MLLRRERLLSLAAIIAALHVAGLSFALGPTCIPYLAAAYLTAVVVWGGVSMSAKKRPMAVIAGAVLTSGRNIEIITGYDSLPGAVHIGLPLALNDKN